MGGLVAIASGLATYGSGRVSANGHLLDRLRIARDRRIAGRGVKHYGDGRCRIEDDQAATQVWLAAPKAPVPVSAKIYRLQTGLDIRFQTFRARTLDSWEGSTTRANAQSDEKTQ